MILLETLSDHLYFYRMSKEHACKLFGRTPRTLKRWEKNPPDWVINIIKNLGGNNHIPSYWSGWNFNGEFFCDPSGNKYHQNDINSLFIQRQLSESLVGDNLTIRSLKTHLEEQLRKQPVLKISLVEQTSNTELQHWSIAL
jgi:hypothetical protein